MVEQSKDDDAGLVGAIRAGIAIALVGPLVVYSVFLLCTGTALSDLPLALLDAAATSALDTLNLFVANPVRGVIAIAVTWALGKIAFGGRRR